MGVLRFKDDVDAILEKDPYDLFSLESPRRGLRRLSAGTLFAVATGVIAAVGIAGLLLWRTSRPAVEDKSPYAYFEVKAIDPDGRPVAGAVVKEGARTVGVTDSFGEWRRFMRVQPGATVMLEISKKVGGAALIAVKSMAVPMRLPKDGDIELTGSVQLARGNLPAAGVATAVKNTDDADKDQPLGLTSMRAAAERRAAGQTDEASVSGTSVRSEATVAREANLAAPAVATAETDGARAAAARASLRARNYEIVEDKDIPTLPARAASEGNAGGGLDLDQLWIVSDAQRPFAPLSEVVGLVKKRARDLGVQLDPQASFRLVVRDLTAAGEAGADAHLLQVEGVFGSGGAARTLFTYLRNYQNDALATARDILWAATVHAPVAHHVERQGRDWYATPARTHLWSLAAGRVLEGAQGQLVPIVAAVSESQALKLLTDADGPCPQASARCTLAAAGIARVAPLPSWQRLPLRVLGPLGEGSRVYVSGFEASAEGGRAGQYGYWGHAGANANVTIVRDGNVVVRGRIVSSARGSTVSVPLGATARR